MIMIPNVTAIALIRLYQISLSRLLHRRGVRCLHRPSCSQYGILAYKKYGFGKATALTLSRYRDCHPFSGRPYVDYP
jgi:putative membrane protein insertion efficiency factor